MSDEESNQKIDTDELHQICHEITEDVCDIIEKKFNNNSEIELAMGCIATTLLGNIVDHEDEGREQYIQQLLLCVAQAVKETWEEMDRLK